MNLMPLVGDQTAASWCAGVHRLDLGDTCSTWFMNITIFRQINLKFLMKGQLRQLTRWWLYEFYAVGRRKDDDAHGRH